MTGPGEGKLSLSAQVYLNAEELPNASVYIHLKGYSRATVTHLDIEHPELNSIIPPKTKTFTWIVGIENGILIITENTFLCGSLGTTATCDVRIRVAGALFAYAEPFDV